MKLTLQILIALSFLIACQPADKKLRPPKPSQKEAPDKKDEKQEPPKEEGKKPPQAEVPAKPEPKEDPNAPKENIDFVYLESKDIHDLGTVVYHYFGSAAGEALEPIVAEGRPVVKKASFNGVLSKSQFAIELSNGDTLDFNNVKLELNKEGRGGYGEYNLIAICVGSTCDRVFVSLFIRESGGFVFNWPLIFKKTPNGKYLPAFQKKGMVLEDAPGEEQAPPQFRVANQMVEIYQKHEKDVLNIIHEQMKQWDAVYSSLFFHGLNKPAVETDFKVTGSEIEFAVQAHYIEPFKRDNLNFSGIFKNEKLSLSDEKAKTTFVMAPVAGEKLFVLMFYQTSFKSLLPHETKGMSAIVCSTLVDNGATYHTCDLMPSSTVLGTIALEGKVGGPFYVKDGEILDKLPPPAEKPAENEKK